MNIFGIAGETFRAVHIEYEENGDCRNAPSRNEQYAELHGKPDLWIFRSCISQNPNRPGEGLIEGTSYSAENGIAERRLVGESKRDELRTGDIEEQKEGESSEH